MKMEKIQKKYVRIFYITTKTKTMKEKTLSELQKLKDRLAWYDLFVDYIYEIDSNKYNEACEYADDKIFDVMEPTKNK